jgi:hypothetical protein
MKYTLLTACKKAFSNIFPDDEKHKRELTVMVRRYTVTKRIVLLDGKVFGEAKNVIEEHGEGQINMNQNVSVSTSSGSISSGYIRTNSSNSSTSSFNISSSSSSQSSSSID